MSSSSSPKPAPANLEAAKAASVSKSSCAESAFVDWSSRMADMVDMDGGKHVRRSTIYIARNAFFKDSFSPC